MGIPVNSDVSLLTTGTVVKGPVTYKPNNGANDTFKVGQYPILDLGTLTGEDTVSQLTVNLGNAASSNGGSTTVNIGTVAETGGSSTITIGSAPTMSADTTIYLGCADTSGRSHIYIGDSINKDGYLTGYVYLGSTSTGSTIYAQGGLIIGSNAQSITGCVYTDTSGGTTTLKFYNGNEWVSLGGGASGDYLPLSGGTLSGALSIGVNVKEYQDTPLFTVEGFTESNKFNLITASGNADGHSSVTIGAQGAAEGTDIRAYGSSVSFYTTSNFSLYSTGGTINIGPCGDSNPNTVNIGNNDGTGGGSGYTTNCVNIGNSLMEGGTTVVIGANSGYSSTGTTVKIGGVSNTSDAHIYIGQRESGSANSFIDIGNYESGSGSGSSFITIGNASSSEHTYVKIGTGSSKDSGSMSSVAIGEYGTTTIGAGGTTYIGKPDTEASSTVYIGVGPSRASNANSVSVSIGHESQLESFEWHETVDIGSEFYHDSATSTTTYTTQTRFYGAVFLPTADVVGDISGAPCSAAGQVLVDSKSGTVYIGVPVGDTGESFKWKALAFVTE
jgi:hypothetical protein